MILHYLYVKEYGILKDAHFKFSDRYEIEYNPRKKLLAIKESKERLPADFFSIDIKQRTVDCISALVGNNGAGKTTVARLLGEIVTESCQEQYLLIYTTIEGANDCNLRCCHSFKTNPGLDVPDYLAVDLILGSFWSYKKMQGVKLLYVTNNYDFASKFVQKVSIMDKERVVDLSTGYLLKNEYLKTSLQLGFKKFLAHEKEEILRILWFFNRYNGVEKRPFDIPIPVFICAEEKRLSVGSKHWFLESLKIEKKAGNLSPAQKVLFAFFKNWFSRVCLSSSVDDLRKVLDHILHDVKGKSLSASDKEDKILKYFEKVRHMDYLDNGKPEQVSYRDKDVSAVKKLHGFLMGKPYLFEGSPQDSLRCPIQDISKVQDFCCFLELYFATVSVGEYLNFSFYPYLSAGEIAQHVLYSRIYDHFYPREGEAGGQQDKRRPSKNIILWFDEIEITIHPGLQRQLVENVIRFLETFFHGGGLRFHVIFATHSPILLSDLPVSNVSFLRREDDKTTVLCRDSTELKGLKNTFGANIHTLYRCGFFLKESLIGSFAEQKIKEALSSEINSEKASSTCAIIGEPFVKKCLEWTIRQRKAHKCPKGDGE